jgi:hypothetical protein
MDDYDHEELPERRDLSDIVLGTTRMIGNIVYSSVSHPNCTTVLDPITGRVLGHYQEEPEEDREYSFGQVMRFMYLVLKESFMHPTKTSYIDRDTLEVRRE